MKDGLVILVPAGPTTLLSLLPPTADSMLAAISSGNFSHAQAACAPTPYFMKQFSTGYAAVHQFLAVVLCSFGAATNLLNIAVLCQRSMRNPTNNLLTALAVSDCVMSALYLPFCIYFTMGDRLKLACPEPYAWQLFLLIQVCITILAHALSSWVTVALAVFRLIYIRLPVRSKQLCTVRTSCLAIGLSLLASICMVVPNIFGHDISPVEPKFAEEKRNSCHLRLSSNTTFYRFQIGSHATINNVNFWVIAIFIKCLPVLLLTILSVLLIRSLRRTVRRRRTLRASSRRAGQVAAPTPAAAAAAAAVAAREALASSTTTVTTGGGGGGGGGDDAQSNRTTKLLITIILVSVLSILPQGAIFLVLGSLSSQEAKNCFTSRFYDPLGDLFDLMTLFNHSINFIFYYGMSKQFRTTFNRLLPIVRFRRGRGGGGGGARGTGVAGGGGDGGDNAGGRGAGGDWRKRRWRSRQMESIGSTLRSTLRSSASASTSASAYASVRGARNGGGDERGNFKCDGGRGHCGRG